VSSYLLSFGELKPSFVAVVCALMLPHREGSSTRRLTPSTRILWSVATVCRWRLVRARVSTSSSRPRMLTPLCPSPRSMRVDLCSELLMP
jgi:hypothetical protein